MKELTIIQNKIHVIRGQKVMLDFDLAELYETETKVLKQSVKRNLDRFPPDFMFELTQTEYNSLRSQITTSEMLENQGDNSLRSQIVTLKNLESHEEPSPRSQIVILESLENQEENAASVRGKHSKYSSFAFTEQGVAMLSSVLKSKKAVLVNISIMRAFVLLRQFALTYNELAQKITELEMKYDGKFEDFQAIIDLLLEEKIKRADWENRQMIGFRK